MNIAPVMYQYVAQRLPRAVRVVSYCDDGEMLAGDAT